MGFLKRLKWRRQRANGQLPECDLWDFKITLARNIEQGLEYLLKDKNLNTNRRRDLEFVLNWARDFPQYDLCWCVKDEAERQDARERFGLGDNFLILTMEEQDEWQKRTKKAFKILGEEIHGLWS